jgi:phosphatidylserine/phosphatidylglycerophosphate/cardiolipin synthase-like enzyme
MNSQDKVSLVVTGIGWMGGGIGSIETAMDSLFKESKAEICLTVYSISNGTDLIFDWIINCLNRGVVVKMVINKLSGQPREVGNRLIQFAKMYPHFQLYEFTPNTESDLHAKVIVVDRKRALVGSSNLSRNGLIANHEMALLVEGDTAFEVSKAFDRLINSKSTHRITY